MQRIFYKRLIMSMLRITLSLLVFCVSLTACAQKYPDQRPAPEKRLFVSEAVEAKIDEILKDCDARIIEVIRRRVDAMGIHFST